jgi:hypothetical protein
MAKKVKKSNNFGLVYGTKCNKCGKQIKSGYVTSGLFRLWNKYFCSLKCAKQSGFEESKSWF